MISWAITFFVIALIAAVLGFSGIAGTAVNIAWILAVVGIVLALDIAVPRPSSAGITVAACSAGPRTSAEQ